MATLARESLALGELIFVPCSVSPFKMGTLATGEQRLQMLILALVDSAMSWASVSEFELNRPAPSYSWETARHFAEAFPEVEWHWILGTDQWDQIEQWAQPEILRDLLHFIVFSREGDAVIDRPGWRYTAVPFEHPASSTAIRADFAGHGEWLTEGVREYCEVEGIYRAARIGG